MTERQRQRERERKRERQRETEIAREELGPVALNNLCFITILAINRIDLMSSAIKKLNKTLLLA